MFDLELLMLPFVIKLRPDFMIDFMTLQIASGKLGESDEWSALLITRKKWSTVHEETPDRLGVVSIFQDVPWFLPANSQNLKPPEGFEPSTLRLLSACSNQLSYGGRWLWGQI
jgi:hypothetical protein